MATLGWIQNSGRGEMIRENGKILAVDPGEKKIGLALSDPTCTLATPLKVVEHISMNLDGAQIAQVAEENQVTLIIVGMPTGGQGEEIRQSRHSKNLCEIIKSQTSIKVILWDETGSTQKARQILIDAGKPRSKRGGHQDSFAAAVILQSYLDSISHYEGENNEK